MSQGLSVWFHFPFGIFIIFISCARRDQWNLGNENVSEILKKRKYIEFYPKLTMNAKCLFLYLRLVFGFERSNLIVCQGLRILMRAPNIMVSSFGIRSSSWKANLISQKCTLFGDAIKDAVVMQFSNKICWIPTRIHVTLCTICNVFASLRISYKFHGATKANNFQL